MYVLCALAVLCLASMSHADPPACDDLVRPLDQVDFQNLERRRGLIAIVPSNLTYLERSKRIDSAGVNFKNETSGIVFMRAFAVGEDCEYMKTNITLEGGSFGFPQYNLTATFLKTSCPDCLVMRFDNNAKEIQRLYVFSKRRTLDATELAEITAQAECLKLHPPVLMNPDKELCPEDQESG